MTRQHLPLHEGSLVDTEVGVMFACIKCGRLLDAAGWARDCSNTPPVVRPMEGVA